jgi:hypothetical protein
LGLGRASGLAPRSMIIVFAPSVIVFGKAKALGFGEGNVGEEDGETMMRERNSPAH